MVLRLFVACVALATLGTGSASGDAGYLYRGPNSAFPYGQQAELRPAPSGGFVTPSGEWDRINLSNIYASTISTLAVGVMKGGSSSSSCYAPDSNYYVRTIASGVESCRIFAHNGTCVTHSYGVMDISFSWTRQIDGVTYGAVYSDSALSVPTQYQVGGSRNSGAAGRVGATVSGWRIWGNPTYVGSSAQRFASGTWIVPTSITPNQTWSVRSSSAFSTC
jgi:hypothetical protein